MKVSGIVQKGKGEARGLGFPTVNLILVEKIPPGIYVGSTVLKAIVYKVAVYIREEGDLLEGHILSFDGDLYDELINITIGKKLREVEDYVDEKTMKDLIANDVINVRNQELCLPE